MQRLPRIERQAERAPGVNAIAVGRMAVPLRYQWVRSKPGGDLASGKHIFDLARLVYRDF
jgi:hypothetical protein